MAVVKPDVNRVWAGTGTIVEPDNAKQDLGWVAEVPTFQNENWLQNRQDNFNLHINQWGVAEWDALTAYPEHAWARSTVDGQVYVSTLVGDNIGNEPSAAPVNQWQELTANLTGTLGTAAARDVGLAAGNVLEVGAFGVGATAPTAFAGDLNTLETTGFTAIAAGATNKPSGLTTGYVLTQAYNATDTAQLAFNRESDALHMRRQLGGTWSAWVTLLVEGAVAAAFDSLVLSQANLVDLVNTVNALNLGSAAPASNPHLAMSQTQIQAKANGTTVAALDIQSLGGLLRLGAQSGTGNIELHADGAKNMEVEGAGLVAIFGDDNTDTDNRLLLFRHADGTTRGRLGFVGSGNFEFRNFVNGGNLLWAAVNSSAANVTILEGDPDGVLTGRHAGNIAWQTRDDGLTVRGRSSAGAINDSYMLLENFAGTDLVTLGFVNEDVLRFRNENNGTNTVLSVRNAGGAEQVIFSGVPDGPTRQFYSGTEVTRSDTAANGGLLINNASTGTGFERALTVSDVPAVSYAVKTSDTQRQNTASPALDSDLSISIDVADIGRYRITGHLWYSAGGGGFQVQANYSTTSNSENVTFATSQSGVAFPIFAANLGESYNIVGATSRTSVDVTGTFEATAGGILRIFWAQQASNAAFTTLLENSYMRIERIA